MRGQQTFSPELLENMGVDPALQDLIVVKSTNHFFAGFAPIAGSIVYCDTGLSHVSPYPSNPTVTNYTRLGDRKIWPRERDPHGIGSPAVPWSD